MKWDNYYLMDCLEGMKNLEDGSVDLILCSPPYDDLRTYKSDTSLHDVGAEGFRVLKEGGIFAMVIQDQTKDFVKSLTTFRTAVDYVDNIGFKLFETVIWKKEGRPGAWWNKRFRVDHEYVLIFLKGKRPQYFDKEPLKVPSKHAGKSFTATTRLTDGSIKVEEGVKTVSDLKCRGTIWEINTERKKTKLKHPASFPDLLAKDIIACFTDEGMRVLDPYLGSGTTCLMAKELNREYMGFEISEEYIQIIDERFKESESR